MSGQKQNPKDQAHPTHNDVRNAQKGVSTTDQCSCGEQNRLGAVIETDREV